MSFPVSRWVRRVMVAAVFFATISIAIPASAATQSGSTGLQGVVPGKPPTVAATITLPSNGASFTTLPITVQGICPGDVLVKLYKNEVFSGSSQCTDGHYEIVSDLFDGRNDLVARVFDAFDQEGPDSNTVTVTYSPDTTPIGNLVAITSVYAKRGVDPKATLTWPFTISNGNGPYAISIDWGDRSTDSLMSQQFPGDFNGTHIYQQSGIYNVIVKVTDKNGETAFLQVVAVGNGPVKQDNTSTAATGTTGTNGGAGGTEIIWWPAAILVPVTITTFWLGKRHQLHIIRKKLQAGDRPF